MNRPLNALYRFALAAGLAGIAGAGIAASRNHPVALAMTVLIAIFYSIGVGELAAFRRDSRDLALAAERDLAGDWMASVPVALRSAVHMRLEGLRVVLPGLALAPAIAGLLVLLGMLGTFIGLVITLSSTASALGASADVTELRSALGAPIQGLGLAFSASVAGVAGSAMLGLMVALSRRERSSAVALLDCALLGQLRPLTSAYRREMEHQAQNAAAMERDNARQLELHTQIQQFTERMADQLASQNSLFHQETSKGYAALAASVDNTLRTSLEQAAREAGAALEPAAAAAMAGIAHHATSLHERVGTLVSDQLGTLGKRFEDGAERIAAQHEAANRAQVDALCQQRELVLRHLADAGTTLQRAMELQGQRWADASQAMLSALDAMTTRHQAAQIQADQARSVSLQAHIDSLASGQASAREAVAQAAQQFATQTQSLLDHVSAGQTHHLSLLAERDEQRHAAARADANAMNAQREAIEQLLATQRGEAQQWLRDSADRYQAALSEMVGLGAEQTQAAAAALTDAFTRLQKNQTTDDAQRLAAWRTELELAGAAQLKHHEALVDGLLANTRSLVTQAESHSQRTLAEAGALLEAAGAAPRAAVEVVDALRQQLAQSQAQDRAALQERAELMETLSTLLASLQRAAGEQRTAIDALMDRSALQLEALGQRFATLAEASGQALSDAATNLAASAADVACVGEGFGEAVQQFQGTNAQLVVHLSALEERVSALMARSDDQLGYYVAQAREVIDLCLGSQKQVLDALQGAAAHG